MDNWVILCAVLLLFVCFLIGSPASVFAMVRVGTKRKYKNKILLMNLVGVTLIVSMLVTPCHLLVFMEPYINHDLHLLTKVAEPTWGSLQLTHLVSLFLYQALGFIDAFKICSWSSKKRIVFNTVAVLFSWSIGLISFTAIPKDEELQLRVLLYNSTIMPCIQSNSTALETRPKAGRALSIFTLLLCVLVLSIYLSLTFKEIFSKLHKIQTVQPKQVSVVQYSKKRRRHTVVGIGQTGGRTVDTGPVTCSPSKHGKSQARGSTQRTFRPHQVDELDIHEEVSEVSALGALPGAIQSPQNKEVVRRSTVEMNEADLYIRRWVISQPLPTGDIDPGLDLPRGSVDILGGFTQNTPFRAGHLQPIHQRNTSTNSFCSTCLCSLSSRSQSWSRSVSETSSVTHAGSQHNRQLGCVGGEATTGLGRPLVTKRLSERSLQNCLCKQDTLEHAYEAWMSRRGTTASCISDSQILCRPPLPTICRVCKDEIRRGSDPSILTTPSYRRSSSDTMTTRADLGTDRSSSNDTSGKGQQISATSSDQGNPIQIRIIRPSRVSSCKESRVIQKPLRRCGHMRQTEGETRERRVASSKADSASRRRRWSGDTFDSMPRASCDNSCKIHRTASAEGWTSSQPGRCRYHKTIRRHRSMSYISTNVNISPKPPDVQQKRKNYFLHILVPFLLFFLSHTIISLPCWDCSQLLLHTFALGLSAVHIWHLLVPFLFVLYHEEEKVASQPRHDLSLEEMSDRMNM